MDNILRKIQLLNRINRSIEVKTLSGNGKGKIVNSLEDMIIILKEMQNSLQILLDNTEKFLSVYSRQLQETDHYAANVLKKGETHD